MPVRFTVTRSANPDLPRGVSWEFVPPGFSIGRQHADCLLPDPEKRVSRHHADVRWQGEDVLLCDQSHNGTLINGEAVGQGNAVRLMDGDVLEIGPYLLEVSFESDIDLPGLDLSEFDPKSVNPFVSARHPAGPPHIGPGAGNEALDPMAVLGPAPPNPGAVFDPFMPRPAAPPPVSPLHAPVAAVHERLELPRLAPQSVPIPNASSAPLHDDQMRPPARTPAYGPLDPFSAAKPASDDHFYELTGYPSARQQQIPPIAPPDPQPGWGGSAPEGYAQAPTSAAVPEVPHPECVPLPQRSPSAPVSAADFNIVWEAFLEGLGVQPEHVAPGDAEAFANIGRLLRAAVEGVMELLQARAKVKYGFAMAGTVGAGHGNNPLKLMQNLEHVLHYLLEPRPGFLSGDQAMSDGLRDMQAHEAAMVAGMQAGLRALVERFDPKALEARLPASGNSPLGSFNRAGRLWQAYVADYEEHVRNNAADLWGEAFNDEYERVANAARYGHGGVPPVPPPRGRRR